ncbi:MAG: tetratricopeptide repeat protein, partial [Planctomycetota bacterium]
MKQINVKLLAILFLSTLFTLIGAFFLYRYQKDRNANGLLTRAQERADEGDYEDAVKFYYRYLQLRPDDNAQYANLALAMKSRISQLRDIGELNAKSFGQAFTMVEQAVRKNPENVDLRNTAIEFSMQFGRYTDAIQHIKFLTNEDDPDPELQVKLASCLTRSGKDDDAIPVLCELIGFDRIDRRFDTTKAKAPKHEDAYQLLANIMHLKARDPESGAMVVNELVKMNPESATAYLKRAGYFSRMQNERFKESISRDLSRALDLAPTDMQIILAAADFAMKEREFDQAKALYDRCLEHHPDSVFAYRGLATWALNTGDRDTAIGFLQKALEIAPDNPVILWARANIELEKRDFEALGNTREELQTLGHPRPFLEFLDGRTHVVKGEWFEASKKLEKSKPQIAQVRPEWVPGLNGALALCYESMGQHDKRLKACQEIVDAAPGNLQARWGVIQSLLAMGQMQKAAEAYGLVERQMKLEQIKMNPALLPAQLQMELLQQDRKPESQRSFADAKDLVDQINKAGMIKDPQVAPVIGAYFEAIGQPEKKAKLDKMVQAEFSDNTSVIAEKIRQIANKDGVEPALVQLAKATSSDTVVPLTLRMMRAELLARVRPEEARQDLKALEADLGSFGEDKRVQITRGLGRIYLLMNDIGEMRRLWQKLAEDRPQDVRVRLSMDDCCSSRCS